MAPKEERVKGEEGTNLSHSNDDDEKEEKEKEKKKKSEKTGHYTIWSPSYFVIRTCLETEKNNILLIFYFFCPTK